MRPRDILQIYNAIKAGLIVLQFSGSAPAVGTGVNGRPQALGASLLFNH
jgi:hypothetical protein